MVDKKPTIIKTVQNLIIVSNDIIGGFKGKNDKCNIYNILLSLFWLMSPPVKWFEI